MAKKTMNSPDPVSVGIVSAGMYLPERAMTATDIAEQSGFPEWVVREKLGINEKRMADPDDHPIQMAVWAAQDCLSKCDIPPQEIHLVVCTTEEWTEYLQWTAGTETSWSSLERALAGCGVRPASSGGRARLEQ